MSKIVSSIQSNSEYVDAVQFAQKYNPKAGTKYDWVARHVTEEYKRLEDIAAGLDEKADSLVRYLGVLVSAMSVAFTYGITQKTAESLFEVIPALVVMLAAIACAMKARMPELSALPLVSRKAFEYADYFLDSAVAEASSAAMTVAASVWLRLANEQKGRLVRWAFRLFLAAVCWLVVAPIITAVWH
jgi:hypothetical protein